MKKIILLGLMVINSFSLENSGYMNCNEVRDILDNVKETKLLISYPKSIICSAVIEKDNKLINIKYELNYNKKSFNVSDCE